MKQRYLLSALLGVFSMALLVGCSDKGDSVALTGIDQVSITSESRPGAVKLKWTVPENANYDYLKVTYSIPGEDKQRLRLASIYSDTILIDNLLNRYGEIQFTLLPCDKGGNEGTPVTVTAQAEIADLVTKTEKTKVTIAGDGVWSDAPELTEGSLASLVDGDENTFFHMNWHDATEFPHYIVLDMGGSTTNFQFKYTCRNHSNKDNPGEMDILVSNEFEDTNAYYQNETGTQLVHSYFSDELPSGKGASFESTTLKSDASFRYLWLKIKASTTGNNYVALSEFVVYKIKGSIYNPETGESTVIE